MLVPEVIQLIDLLSQRTPYLNEKQEHRSVKDLQVVKHDFEDHPMHQNLDELGIGGIVYLVHRYVKLLVQQHSLVQEYFNCSQDLRE